MDLPFISFIKNFLSRFPFFSSDSNLLMAPYTLRKFIKDQYTHLPLITADLTGRVVIVVGANVGLGLETARHFARMNPKRLILACRNTHKGEVAKRDIEATTSCRTVEVSHVDLIDFASISAFASRFEGRLDLLVLNAGVVKLKYEKSIDGWEQTLQTNHLGSVLLALLLFPFLASSPPLPSSSTTAFPRITIVGSDAHHFIKSVAGSNEKGGMLEKLNERGYCTKKKRVMRERYGITKLFNVLFARSLVAHLPSQTEKHTSTPPVIVTVVNPGFTHSSIGRDASGFLEWVYECAKAVFARSASEASRTILHAALCEGKEEEVQAGYMNCCRVESVSDFVKSEEGAKVGGMLWDETIDVLRKVDPRVDEVLEKYLNGSGGIKARL